MAYKYRNVRIVCQGTIKGCDECKDIVPPAEGYCKLCNRPLWKKIGESCNSILGYYDGDYRKSGKVHVKCILCRTIHTI